MKYPVLWICLLAACGGGGSGGSGGGIDPRLARLDIYAAQNLRVLGDPSIDVPAMVNTPDIAIPDVGGVDFSGSASIRVEASSGPLVLFGDTTITLDFDLGTANGSVSNVFGETASGAIADYAGQLTLSGGPPAQKLLLGYTGTLTGGATTLVFGGTLRGDLLGEPIGALAVADLEAVIDQDGVMRSGTIIIVAEDVPRPPPPIVP